MYMYVTSLLVHYQLVVVDTCMFLKNKGSFPDVPRLDPRTKLAGRYQQQTKAYRG
jgi:hypothetical protein